MPRTKTKKEEENPKIDNSKGPSVYNRDGNGLLNSIQYVFKDDGSIDWRAMVPKEHLYPNKKWFKDRKKDVPLSVDGLKDDQLLIRLAGIKELAKIRGFKTVSFVVDSSEKEICVTTCKIEFDGNYETGMEPVLFSEVGSASICNTSGVFQKYLESIAANRAFVRCVRNFLNIHIVSDEEVFDEDAGDKLEASKETSGIAAVNAVTSMQKVFEDAGYEGWDGFLEALRELYRKDLYKNTAVSGWKEFDDIDPEDARKILAAFKKMEA